MNLTITNRAAACSTTLATVSQPALALAPLNALTSSRLHQHSTRQTQQQHQHLRCTIKLSALSHDDNNSSNGNGAEPPEPPELDANIRVKLSLAASSDKLDMSDCDLGGYIPPQVFELTDLEELSLAGNNLTELPAEIGKLTSLRLLQLAGNELKGLPHEIGCLTKLEGLWLHGNYIEGLPEAIGNLTALTQLSLSGNRLERLPEETCRLRSLKDLSVAGNRLTCLPVGIGELSQLEKLSLHGNKLRDLPPNLTGLMSLKELWLQGNPYLAFLPDCLGKLEALQHLSLADCGLVAVPSALGKSPSLKTLTLYGNWLHSIPQEILEAPQLQYVWAEGNPLLPETGLRLVRAAGTAGPDFKSIGLDEEQASSVSPNILSTLDGRAKITHVIPPVDPDNSLGYFKLERSGPCNSVLVVAFGSAPGTPNWGGCLNKVKEAAPDPRHNDFDCLYVVDPTRSWYGGGDAGFEMYEARLKAATAGYKQVVMIGDSMGATASLLFAHLATAVHAFCPQIDLRKSSIRPAQDHAWYSVLQTRVLQSLERCPGKVTIHTGNWAHDLDQCNAVPNMENVHVQIYSVDSHRLALALDRAGKLTAVVRSAISEALDLPGNNVRISNLY